MRYVLIDRFLELNRGVSARAVKCVTKGEPFLRELPAYPPSLVLEALLQTGGVLARTGAPEGTMSVLGKVNRAEFPERAQAGDRIVLDVKAVQVREDGTMCEGVARVGDTIVGEAEFMIVFLPADMAPPPDPERLRHRRTLMRALALPSMEEA